MKFASTINLTIITMMIIIYLNEMRNISAFIFNFTYIKDLARIIMDEKCNHVYCEAETDRYQIAKNSYRLLMPNDVFNSKTYIIFAFIISIMIFIYYYRMLDLSNYEGTWLNHAAYVIIHVFLLIILLGMIIYRYTPHDEAGYLNYFKYFSQGSTESNGFASVVGLLMYLFIPLFIVSLKRWNEKLWKGSEAENNITSINIFVALCCFIASITLMFNLMNIVMSFRTNTRPILKTKCLGWSLQQSFKGHDEHIINTDNKGGFAIETEYGNIKNLKTGTDTAANTKGLLEGCGANISSALDVLIAFEELTNVVINGHHTATDVGYFEKLKNIINSNFTKIYSEKDKSYTQDTSEFALIFDKKVSIPNMYGPIGKEDPRINDVPRFSSEHSVNSNDRNKDYVYTADISYDNANVFYEKYWDMNDTEHDFLWRYDYFVPTYLFSAGTNRPNLLKILNYVATFTVSIVIALAIICLCLSITGGNENKDIFKKIFNIKTLYDLLIPFIALVVFLTFIIVFIRFNTNFNKNVVYKCLDCSYKRALNKLNTVVSPYIRMYDNKITTGNKNYLSHYIVTNVFYSILSGNINLNDDQDRAINKSYDDKYYYGTDGIKSNRLKFTDMNNSILSNDNQFREYYKSRYSDLYKSVADDKAVLSDEIKKIYNVFLNIFGVYSTVPTTAAEIDTYFQGTILKRETILKMYSIIKRCFELFNEETFNNNLIYYNNRDPKRNTATQITIKSYEHFAFYKNGDKLIPHQFILKLKNKEYDAFIGTGAAGFNTEFSTTLSKFSPPIDTDMTPILSDISDEDSINQTPEVRNKNLIKIIAKYLLILGHINYNGCEYNLYDDETIKNEIYELRTRNLYKLFSNVSYNDTFEIDDTFTSINIEGSDTVKHIIVRNRGNGYSHTDKDIKITPTGVNTTPVIATANINYEVLALASILITDGGSGYITAPTIAITGGSGSGATATAHLSELGIVSIKVVNRGAGYTSAPTIKIEGGGGTGATATATLNTDKTLKSIKVDTAGAGYTSAPTIKIEGGGGTGATATAHLGIENKITNPKYKTLTYMYNYLETKYVSLSSNNNKNYLLNVVTSINNTLNNDDKTITASGSKDSKYLFAKKINEMKVPPEYEDEDAIYTKADYISTTSFESTYYMNLLILICFIIGTIYANIKKSV